MSRYDGLIIPRSYSEYINKTDAATLQQALQLSGVLSGAVAAGDNKAVKSSAVNAALINKSALKIVIKTDANECLPNGYNEESFFVGIGSSNIPIDANFVIKAMRIGNDSETRRYHQIAYKVADGALTNGIYTRVGIKGAPDPAVVWSNWGKIVTEAV